MESLSNLESLLCRQAQNHRHFHIGRDLRGFFFFFPELLLKAGAAPSDTRLLRAMFSQVLRTSKDKTIITSLGDLPHCPHGKQGLPYMKPEQLFFFSSFSYAHCILSFHHATPWRALFCVLHGVLVSFGSQHTTVSCCICQSSLPDSPGTGKVCHRTQPGLQLWSYTASSGHRRAMKL